MRESKEKSAKTGAWLRANDEPSSLTLHGFVFPAMPISLETVEASIPYHGGFVKLLLNVPIA